MVLKRKFVATISLGLLSLLGLSVVPVYFGGVIATEDEALVRTGDVLRYRVIKFNVDFTVFNELKDNPFEIDDPTLLKGSVLYFKILRVRIKEVTFAVGFILGKDAQVRLDPTADWPPEIETALLPIYAEFPAGAGVPFFWGDYNLDHPFPSDWEPDQLPLFLDPNANWSTLLNELEKNWEPTSIEMTVNTLTASWQQAIASDEEGIKIATLVWNRETGILMQAAILGQKAIDGAVSPFDFEITFMNKENIGLPAEAYEGYLMEYILTDVDVYQSGFEAMTRDIVIDLVMNMTESLEDEPVLLIEIINMDGLFYEFNSTLFPNHLLFEVGPEKGTAMAFGLGFPFLTPDWEFYTSVWATGNLIIDIVTGLVGVIRPEAFLEIDQFLLDLKVAEEEGYHYFGFILDEKAEIYEPRAGITISTENNGEGWLAYEDDGLFAGIYLTISGSFQTLGILPHEGGNLDIDYKFTIKIDRKDIEVPQPSKLKEPKFTPPPLLEDQKEEEPETPGGFIPGFDLIAAVVALLMSSVIVVRKKRTN